MMTNRLYVSVLLLLFSLITFGATTLSIKAETFLDNFDELIDADWDYPNPKIWYVRDGFLHVSQPRWQGEGKPRMPVTYFLKFTGFRWSRREFDITVTNIASAASGGFGIALGRTFPEIQLHDIPSFYIFKNKRITARQFRPNDSGGGAGPFVWLPNWMPDGNRSAWAPKCPETIWNTKELQSMEVRYNAGRFQMFADGNLRADFVDAHFDKISIIGFLLMGNHEWGGSQGWVDSFMISGPLSESVYLRDQLTAAWGQIKRCE